MPKRLTDSEKWEDAWFTGLSDNNKFLWLYLLDKCDHAGIWEVNVKRAEQDLWAGCLDEMEAFEGRIEEVAPGRWYIPKFIRFQYGEFREHHQVHQSVMKILNKYGLDWPEDTVGQGLVKSRPTYKDKDKGKEKDKDVSTRDEIFERFWKSYPNKSGKIAARKEWDKLKLWERIDDVLLAVANYKRTAKAPYILMPERWIKKGHWMDEVGGSNTESTEDAAARTRRWIERTGGVTR